MASSMRSVEFVGIPGAGKTTLSRGVAEFLRGNSAATVLLPEKAAFYAAREHCERSVRTVLRLLPEALGQRFFNALGGRTFWQQEFLVSYLLGNHKLLQSVLDAAPVRGLSDHELKVVFTGLLQSGGLLECLRQSSGSDWWVLFDEGMLQKSMMFVTSQGTFPREAVERYLSHIVLPDVVVNLQVDKGRCLQRMLGRSKGLTGRLRTHSEPEAEAFLDNSIAHWEFVTSWLRDNTDIPVLQIGTEPDQSELIRLLGAELEQVIGTLSLSKVPGRIRLP